MTLDEEIERLAARSINGCPCDFCTGKKRYEDNWCARCAEVRMEPPKWWENCDVCDACEEAIADEIAAELAQEIAAERSAQP